MEDSKEKEEEEEILQLPQLLMIIMNKTMTTRTTTTTVTTVTIRGAQVHSKSSSFRCILLELGYVTPQTTKSSQPVFLCSDQLMNTEKIRISY